MAVYRFEDLRVWQAAKQQCDLVGNLIKRPAFRDDRELASQMNAAALSVMFNISEGFLRRRDKETAQFLRYAFASNGELKAGYYAAEGRRHIATNESIAKMLRRWMGTLNTDRGPEAKHGPSTKNQGRTKAHEPRPRD
jgi:four helix bundle protein